MQGIYRQISECFKKAEDYAALVEAGKKVSPLLLEAKEANRAAYLSLRSCYSFYMGIFKGTLEHPHPLYGRIIVR